MTATRARTLLEQETVIRFDRSSVDAALWTADASQARRWERRGYPVEAKAGGWWVTIPKRLVSFRRLPLPGVVSARGQHLRKARA